VRRSIPLLVLAPPLMVACGPTVRLGDSLDDSLAAELYLALGDDYLVVPYVAGLEFDLEVVGRLEGLGALEVRSSNPEVIEVGEGAPRGDEWLFPATAVDAGETMLTVLADGRVVAEEEAQVVVPDRVEAVPVGRLVAVESQPDPLPTVVVGGLAEVELHYFVGAVPAYGAVHPTLSTSEGLVVGEGAWREDDRNDVVWLSPSRAGRWTVELGLAHTTLDLEVDAVDGAGLLDLALACEDRGSGFDLEVPTACQVRGIDLSGDEVWGVDATWTVDDRVLAGAGDLVSLRPDDSAERAVSARYEGLAATARIAAHPDQVLDAADAEHVSWGDRPRWVALGSDVGPARPRGTRPEHHHPGISPRISLGSSHGRRMISRAMGGGRRGLRTTPRPPRRTRREHTVVVLPGTDRVWNASAVCQARHARGFERVAPDRPRRPRLPDRFPDGRYSDGDLARAAGVSAEVVRRWITQGRVASEQGDFGQHRRVWWLDVDATALEDLRRPTPRKVPRKPRLPQRRADGRYSVQGALVPRQSLS